MKAMILAAGLGTRLRPMTNTMPKPMVPVLDRPVMGHIVRLLRGHELTRVVANLHHFPDTIRDHFGDGSTSGIELSYSYEQQLLGTAGGVRNCREFFGSDPFLVISGDALTDIDLQAMRRFHGSHDGIATLAVKQVAETQEYGVVIHDGRGRIQGFQEKPDPAEALSDLANCGIYMFDPEIFDYFPDRPFVDWAQDVFPVLLDNDVPFYAHAMDAYWNDVGTIAEYRQSNFDAARGVVRVDHGATEVEDGLWVGEGTDLAGPAEIEAPCFIGGDCTLGSNVRIGGPTVIGPGCTVGPGAMIRGSVLWPDTALAEGQLVIDAVVGQLRPPE